MKYLIKLNNRILKYRSLKLPFLDGIMIFETFRPISLKTIFFGTRDSTNLKKLSILPQSFILCHTLFFPSKNIFYNLILYGHYTDVIPLYNKYTS